MPTDKSVEKDVLSLVSGERPGGRPLFAALAIFAAVLLVLLGSQTEPGFDGGGWWNEPRNGPLVSLGLLFICSLLAAVFAAPTSTKGIMREALLTLGLSVSFLASVWLIPKIGYGLSVLVFSTIGGVIAGFRGRRLLFTALGLTALMLVIFRYVLGLWFPRAALFKLTPWLDAIGGYL